MFYIFPKNNLIFSFICFTFYQDIKLKGQSMKFLSLREEQILITIWELKESAYLLAIRDHLSNVIGKKWSIGATHKPLRKLEKGGFIDFYMAGATAKRGGRSKKIYTITPKGMEALIKFKKAHDAL